MLKYCYTCHRSFRLDEIEKHNIIKDIRYLNQLEIECLNLNINKEILD